MPSQHLSVLNLRSTTYTDAVVEVKEGKRDEERKVEEERREGRE